MRLKEVNGRYDGPRLEKEILDFWGKEKIFEKSVEKGDTKPLYIWNEGPPTANGKPGIHHVLARTFKDLFPRFKTMRGFHCPRKAGWDTHGLPVEHEVEKELGIFDKAEIERQVGIAEFTRRCRESVMRYIDSWEKMTERMGFWVKMDEAYYTLNNDFIETVWWLLKTLWDKGLIYQGHKVVPYDPRIGATLSSHEVALGYKEVDDPSVTVRFRLLDDSATSFLVWTTTPWTLPSNLALAVNPDVDYVYVDMGEEVFIVASALKECVLGATNGRVVRTVKGIDLVGAKYKRLFNYLPASGPICQVWAADFVTTEDGTGIVHCAPGYGEDDAKLCQENGIPVVHGVGLDGCFLDVVKPLAGLFFKDADPVVIDLLEQQGCLFRVETHRHNYPHGWRTGDPLIYYAKNAWYIRTSDYRDRMVTLNKTINWVPSTIREGRFGNWLSNNVDWALSRERFWGTPLPIWTDGEGDFVCVGSVKELEILCGQSLSDLDLHRPAVDEIEFTHPENGRLYQRVPDVIDCWFDSGAMSYAQFHYPFENKETFENHFPADYICEAIDQTRGWFYSLHAIATLVSDSVAYKNCVCLAHIVDGDGKKMSKSQGNIVDPYDVFDSVGADALRWYLSARIAPEVQKRISVKLVEEVASTFINTYWNTYSFFVLYARLDDFDPTKDVSLRDRATLDLWILALLQETITRVTDALDAYDVREAGVYVETFVDQLSNWYVRRNRKRFWKAAAGDDKQAAYLTLYECIETVNRLIAPIMPFLSENIYQNIGRGTHSDGPISVHMASWPTVETEKKNACLLKEMEVVQIVVGLGRAARNNSGVRVRQPLARLLVRVPDEWSLKAVLEHRPQILEELNVKDLQPVAPDAQLVEYRIKPNLPRIGKRYGKLVPGIKEALLAADGLAIASAVAAEQGFELTVSGQSLSFEADDVLVETISAEGYSCAEDKGYLVGLDITIDYDLRIEGLARELIRTVQDSRKQAGLDVSDRIVLSITGDNDVAAALRFHQDLILSETLAESWGEPTLADHFESKHKLEKVFWTIRLAKYCY